jgi:hypothetical protein
MKLLLLHLVGYSILLDRFSCCCWRKLSRGYCYNIQVNRAVGRRELYTEVRGKGAGGGESEMDPHDFFSWFYYAFIYFLKYTVIGFHILLATYTVLTVTYGCNT